MDYTVETRKTSFKRFMMDLSVQYKDTVAYKKTMDIFDSEYLNKGVEGSVFKAHFKRPRYFYDTFVVKTVDMAKLRETHYISKKEYDLTPEQLYELFLSAEALNKPSLTEIVSQTLTNQLVFQNICPNFNVNYYWELTLDKELATFNEFASASTLDEWGKIQHSDREWFSVFFQIMMGLIAIKRYYGMIHTDFHTGNILLQKVQPGGYWKYTVDGRDFFVPNHGYVVMLHDFGFAWVPGKLTPVHWHYKQTLKYITNVGKHLFDINTILSYLMKRPYRLPRAFKNALKKNFGELRYVLSAKFYKENNEDGEYDEWLAVNKHVSVNFSLVGVELLNKLVLMYGDMYESAATGELIEAYSLDIPLKTSKLPKCYRFLVDQSRHSSQ